MVFQWYNNKYYCLGSIYVKNSHKLTTDDDRGDQFTVLTVILD